MKYRMFEYRMFEYRMSEYRMSEYRMSEYKIFEYRMFEYRMFEWYNFFGFGRESNLNTITKRSSNTSNNTVLFVKPATQNFYIKKALK